MGTQAVQSWGGMGPLRVKDKELLSMEAGLEKWQYFKLLFPHTGFRFKIQKN